MLRWMLRESTHYESFYSVDVHVLIRFGAWGHLINIDMSQYTCSAIIKDGKSIYPYTIAITHYGQAIAQAVKGNVVAAKEAYGLFKDAVGKVPADRVVHNNSCHSLLHIADSMLLGELAYRESRYSE